MHGIFYYAFKRKFPIRKYVEVSASSQLPYSDWLRYDKVIENIEHKNGWASENIPNSYIEFKFINTTLFLKSYVY